MYKLISWVSLALLIQGISCQNSDVDPLTNRATNNDLKCFVCSESSTQACGDPIDTTNLPRHACNTLDYGHQQPRGSDGSTKLVPVIPLLKEVFGDRERFANRIIFEYECIKFVENDGVERACIQKPANIEDACDFFQKEKPSVKSCKTCTTDDCNSSSSLRQSVILIAAIIMVLFKLF